MSHHLEHITNCIRTGSQAQPFPTHLHFPDMCFSCQAREYLYYKLTGVQLTTPVAVMTSDAKGNHARMSALMERLDWMGRGREAFTLFRYGSAVFVAIGDGVMNPTDMSQQLQK